MSCPTNYEEEKWGYLRSLNQGELQKVIDKCNEDIQDYEDAEGIEKSDYEPDRNRAVHILRFIEKNNLKHKKKL